MPAAQVWSACRRAARRWRRRLKRTKADDPHRLGALSVIGEKENDQRQRDRRHDGAAEALDRSRTIRNVLEVADPHNSDAIVNSAIPNRKTRFCPKRSPRRPASSRSLQREQVGVDDPGQRGLGEPEVGPDRRASATPTIVESSTIIRSARQSTSAPASAFWRSVQSSQMSSPCHPVSITWTATSATSLARTSAWSTGSHARR